MYRGRPPHRGGYTPHRGGYPPPYEGRGPAYREDRGRFRPPPHHHHHHHGYHDHGAPEPYRRSSPPRRRHPSPGERRHPSPGERRHPSPGERRHPSPGGGRHPSPGGGRHPSPGGGRHRGGEYWSGRPASRERSQSPRCAIPIDRNLVITVGNELTGPAGSAPPRHLHTPHDRDHSRGRSRPRSCSRDRGRAQSRGRSKSRARSKSRGRSKSRARSPSCSPDHRGRARTRSRSPERSRARSHGRSKSWSRSRSRSRSRGRSYGHSRSGVRSRSRSLSTSSSSSSSSSLEDGGRSPTMEFQELELARRRKEIEELLSKPTKSILKRRPGAEDSPSLRSDSPGGPDSGNISRVAEHLLSVFKGMQPQALASLMAELKADPQMAQRVGLDSELTGILSLLGRAGGAAAAEKEKDKAKDDIEDEEKFLYGDCEEPKPALAHEARAHSFSELYGDMTEEALYGEVPPATAPQSRSTIAPNQNITVHVTNTTYPPGTEPLQESEIQAVEEYDKIQDLLKTIGLDLGVSEITKMAARTKERLHGNKPPPKRRRYSSGSSAGSRGRKSLSGNSDSSQSRGGSWSSGRSSSAGRRTHNRKLSPPAKPHSKQGKSEWVAPPPCDPPPQPPTPHTAIPMPPYSQTPAHPMAPPNYPPPGYGQYGSYMPYMPQQWPPMYPPPGMPLPHQAPREDYPPISPYKRPYNQTIQPDLGPLKSDAQDVRMEVSKEREKNFSDEKNNESQKQKVLEEREKLRQDKEMRMKKKECLMKELERLRKQQGELLRKKRREKDGHKDPLLSQISGLQEHVMRQISELRKEHEAAEKKRTEINKVALILGLSPSDRPRRAARPSRGAGEEEEAHRPPMEKRRRERSWNPEELPHPPNTTKQVAASRASPNKAKQSVTASAPPPAPPMATPSELFEYYDAGNHWCKHCNVTSGSMFDFFTHMHSKSHRKTQDPYDRPWASNTPKTVKNSSSEEKMTKPAKGSEFLLPVRGFFCLLCREFYGDGICAEEHVMTHAHNEKYKKQMCENPLYEQRRNLDRQAGLSVDTTGRKRKDEDQSGKDKEEKSKHRKERKDKEKKKGEEEASIPKNEDRENKVKPSKEEAKPAKKEEEERAMFIRQDEDEKYKPLKKEERYKHSREEEYCYRYRREEEELRFRPGRGDDRFRYDDDKYRYSKYPESRDKYDREKDEGRSKGERDVKPSKKNEQPREEPKPEAKKPEPPPKPYDPPKVLCGPSPAMRAKLRKQSSETAKAAPVAMPPNFGKFTWKKKENVLAKEAERVAAEFLKDEEVAAAREPIPVEDSFAKSVAVAKEIALKLSGQPGLPLPWAGQAANPARIRPNLPAPAMALRKTAMLAKPAPLDTFLSIKPPNTGSAEPLPMESPVVPDNPAKDLGGLDIPVPAPVERPVEMPVEAVPEVEQPTQPIETLIRIESDVAAPGVPESEQRRAVFVKPPPFMNSGDGAHKSDKLKTNLAAAKAKDLFDIFLGGLGQSGPFTKPSVTKTNQTAQRKTVQPNPTPQPQRQSNAAPGPSQIGPSPDPKSDQRKPTPPHQPQDICHIQSVALVPKHQVPPAEPNKLKPDLQSSQLQIQPAPPVQSPPQVRSLPQSPPQVCSPPLSQARSPPQVLAQSPPQVQSQTLVCSQPQLQSIPLPLLQPNPQLDQSQVQPQVQPQLLTEIQVDPPQLEQVEPDPDSQPFQPDPASQSTPAPLTPPKTKPKTKTSPQSKKTSPTTRPVRQTRSQTRYQTRQQQQQLSEPESEQVLEHPELVPPSPNGLETGLISASQPEENVPDDTPPNMETLDPAVITPETLGLPSDMMSLGFEYDFNFE